MPRGIPGCFIPYVHSQSDRAIVDSIWAMFKRTVSVGSVADMSILLFNGFLLLGFVVATVPDGLVLGSSGFMPVDPPPKKCTYSRVYKILQASCTTMELHDIPTNLKSDIQVRLSNIRLSMK